MMKRKQFNIDMVTELNTFIQNDLHLSSRFIQKPFDQKYIVNEPSINHIYNRFDIRYAEDAQYAQYLIEIGFKYSEMVSTGKDKFLEVYQYNGIYWENVPIHNAEFHKGRFDYLQKWCGEKIHMCCGVIAEHSNVPPGETMDTIKQKVKALLRKRDVLVKLNATDDTNLKEVNKELQQLYDWDNSLADLKTYETAQKKIAMLSRCSLRKSIIEIYLSKLHVTIEWDKNPELFAFNNCIMNLATGEMVTPSKTQYIKTTCGWNWDPSYDNSKVDTIRQLVNSILPIETVRDYYMTYESTGMSGNKVQRVLINTGTGGNGKSLLRELKNKVIGDYGMKLPTEILCSAIKASGANPVIANMDGKRSLYFSEPDSKQKICTATLKEITGDTEIVGRKLYSGDTKVHLIATLSGDCNTIPLFDSVQADSKDSILRRLGISPFITKAVTLEEYELAEDKTYLNIKRNYAENAGWIDDNKQAYFILLHQAYLRYKANPELLDNLPEECKNRAVAHISASCDILCWIDSEMEPMDETDIETSTPIPLKSLYERFRTHPQFKTFTKAEQRKYCQKYFIDLIENAKGLKRYIKNRKERHNKVQLSSSCLIGYRFVNDEPEIEQCGFLGELP
jgi:hypothetical protein